MRLNRSVAVEVDRAEFDSLVSTALDSIPPQLAQKIDNVVVVVEDNPPPGNPYLLGLYEGIPLTKRGPASYAGALPDHITIYRNPILRICGSPEQVIEEVRKTVVHEIGHFFGIGDARLHELGY